LQPAPNPPLTNNAFINSGGLTTQKVPGATLVDLLVELQQGSFGDGPGVNEGDLCYWSMQTLPPPAGPAGKYEWPDADMQRYGQLGKMANDRLNDFVKAKDQNGGVVAFASLANGQRASKKFCDMKVLWGVGVL